MLDTADQYERRINRIAAVYITCVVLLHLGLLVYGIYIHGPGWDEPGHLAAGISHWQTGRFDGYRVNPPLSRMVATIPLMFRDVGIEWKWNPEYTPSRFEFDLGRQLIDLHGKAYFDLLRSARLSGLVFSVIALWIVFRWSRELFGTPGAMLSLTVWAFSPLVLTNFQLVTPDPASAALGAVACYTFRHWLNQRTAWAAFLCGVALGLAELTKFTWIILFAVWPVQWLICRCLLPTGTRVRADLFHLLLIFGVGIFTINLGYGFEDSFTRLGTFRFQSKTLGADKEKLEAGNRFVDTWLAQVPVPLPGNMVTGIDRQKVDFESKMNSYLRGVERFEGWWYYYLYGLLVKEPVGFLLLGFMSLILVLTRGLSRQNLMEWVHLLLPAVALFAFVSSQTGFNHHMRYVLPSLPFFAMGMGVCCTHLVRRRECVIAWTLAFAGVTASLLEFPHSHAFFNILVGGQVNGALHLQNSNVDWGQDILLLEKWAKQNPDKPLDGVAYVLPLWLGVYQLTDLPRKEVPELFPPGERPRGRIRMTNALPSDDVWLNAPVPDGPLPGRYALSVLHVHEPSSKYRYFKDLQPVARVGRTTLIYEVSIQDANRIRAATGLPLLTSKQHGIILPRGLSWSTALRRSSEQ